MSEKKFRPIDLIVLVVFIFTAFLGLYLFRQDLMQTIEVRDMEPAGIIVIRNNVVQRRHENRVIWDRIFVDSPVYPGDLIRAAQLSSTNIDIDKNDIFLNENTLIRIQQSMTGNGKFLVELQEGNLSVTSSEDSEGLLLDLMGSQVQTGSGSVLNASVDEEGIAVQVSEGTAEFVVEGKAREITEGSMVALDKKGAERKITAAVVTRPVSNARILNNKNESMQITFSWNRINLDNKDFLRLETASDLNFSNNYSVFDNLFNSAKVSLNAGLWHWKLSYEDKVLSKGQFTVIDSSGPALLSPVADTTFRFKQTEGASRDQGQLRFQWADRPGASSYLIEINDTPDFSSPKISRESVSASMIFSQPGAGVWFWRVKPVFVSANEGEAVFSSSSSFRVELTKDFTAPAIEIPVISEEKAAQSRVEAIRSSVTTAAVNNAARPAPIPIPARQRFHTILRGETLGRISRQYYGDPMQWNKITDANNISNPDIIYPGQIFIIPF